MVMDRLISVVLGSLFLIRQVEFCNIEGCTVMIQKLPLAPRTPPILSVMVVLAGGCKLIVAVCHLAEATSGHMFAHPTAFPKDSHSEGSVLGFTEYLQP